MEITKSGKRMLGSYFRVAFYGQVGYAYSIYVHRYTFLSIVFSPVCVLSVYMYCLCSIFTCIHVLLQVFEDEDGKEEDDDGRFFGEGVIIASFFLFLGEGDTAEAAEAAAVAVDSKSRRRLPLASFFFDLVVFGAILLNSILVG